MTKLNIKSAMIRRMLFITLCAISTPSIQAFDTIFVTLENNVKALFIHTFTTWIKTTKYIKKEYPELALSHIKCLGQGPTGCNIHAFRNCLYLLAITQNPRLSKKLYKEMLNLNLYTIFASTLGFTSNSSETYTAFTKAHYAISNNHFSNVSQECIPQNSHELIPKIVKFNPYITNSAETKASFLTLEDLEARQKIYASLIQSYENVDKKTAQEYAYYAAFLPRYDFIDPRLIKNMESFNVNRSYFFCCIIHPCTVGPHAVALLLTKKDGITSYYFADSATTQWDFGPSHIIWKNQWYQSQMLFMKQVIAFSNSYQLLQDSLIRSVCLYTLTQTTKKAKALTKECIDFLKTHDLEDESLYTQHYKNYL